MRNLTCNRAQEGCSLAQERGSGRVSCTQASHEPRIGLKRAWDDFPVKIGVDLTGLPAGFMAMVPAGQISHLQVIRAELSALTNLLIKKGIITLDEMQHQLGIEADELNALYEQKFPGVQSLRRRNGARRQGRTGNYQELAAMSETTIIRLWAIRSTEKARLYCRRQIDTSKPGWRSPEVDKDCIWVPLSIIEHVTRLGAEHMVTLPDWFVEKNGL